MFEISMVYDTWLQKKIYLMGKKKGKNRSLIDLSDSTHIISKQGNNVLQGKNVLQSNNVYQNNNVLQSNNVLQGNNILQGNNVLQANYVL